MFADPTVTINSVAQALKRTGMGPNQGTFQTNDGTHKLTIAHSVGKFNQRMIRLDRTQNVASPLVTGEFLEAADGIWLVSKTPRTGYLTVAVQKQLIDGYLAMLTASSGALISQLLGGEC